MNTPDNPIIGLDFHNRHRDGRMIAYSWFPGWEIGKLYIATDHELVRVVKVNETLESRTIDQSLRTVLYLEVISDPLDTAD